MDLRGCGVVATTAHETSTTTGDLDRARELTEAGVPVFIAPPNPDYDPTVTDRDDPRSREFLLPGKWQETPADPRTLDGWKPGYAVCLVTGHGLDAADIDPKNGAEVVAQGHRLEAVGVERLGTVVTPSGGAHFYTRSTGIGSASRTAVGVDFRGRGLDGSGAGFLYLPGTSRPKYDGTGYVWAQAIAAADLDDLEPTEDNTDAVATYLTGLGITVRTRRAQADAAEVGGEPVERDTLRPWLLSLVEDLGPEWETGKPGERRGSRDRSERFFHLVAACRRAGLTQGQTVTVLDPWCHGVGKYAGRVAAEVARSWGKVEPETETYLHDLDALDEAGRSLPEPPSGDDGYGEDEGPSSWAPLDLSAYLDGSYVPEVPALFPRADGSFLLYPGRLHSFHGESESGKSLLAQAEAARLLCAGERVLFLDFESDAAAVVARLGALGASRSDIADRLDYVRPEASLRTPAAREAFSGLLSRRYALAVLDGVTEALSLLTDGGGKPEEQIVAFVRLLPRRIARETGAAVVQVDHVTKSAEGRGRFAIGSQHKMNSIDGAAYVVEVSEPLGLGLRGVVVLRVAKDRPGSVRPVCGSFRKGDRTQEAARVVLDATETGRTVVTVQAPTSKVGEHDEDAGPWRPTGYMERVSRWLEDRSEPASGRAIVSGVGGKAGPVGDALEVLLSEGWVKRTDGARGAKLHTSIRAYRQDDDPASDRYTGEGSAQPPETASEDPESDRFRFPVLRPGESGSAQPLLSTASREALGKHSGSGHTVTETDLFDTGRDPWKEPPLHACGGPSCSVPGCPNGATA